MNKAKQSSLLMGMWLLSLLVPIVSFAQNRTITGTVIDETGSGLPGVSVMFVGTTIGGVTDFDGKYSLNIPTDASQIQFSYIGYLGQTIEIGTQSIINVSLEPDADQLDEVVVIGYGSAKAKDLTSPITTVDSEELNSMNVTSAMSAIQGKIPGVNIVNSGAPGAGPTVRIRGTGSMGDASPLYVVNGMFFDNIDFLNPSDIESMSVLKDASAAAIYGVRAANGVVIITTKGGSKGSDLRVTYDGYYGVQKVTQTLEMANTAQYSEIMRASGQGGYIDAAVTRFGGENGIPSVSTDWYNELTKSQAAIQNHSLDLSGGTNKTTYSFGVNYFDQESIMEGDGFYSRYNIRSKIDYDLNKSIKVGMNFMLSNSDYRADNQGSWFQAYTAAPIYPVMDETLTEAEAYPKKYANPHNLGYTTYYTNPLATQDYYNNLSSTFRVMPSLYLEAKMHKNLKFKTAYSLDYSQNSGRTVTPVNTIGQTTTPINTLNKYYHNNHDYIWDNTLTYTNSWGKHDLSVMGGFSIREENYRNNWGQVNDIPEGEEEYYYLGNGDQSTLTTGDGGTTYRGVSGFTRIAYDYDSRYILSATMRADGSSKYQQTWGYFPSIGAAWVASEENFLKDVAFLDFLKVRASWGLLGNDKVAANDGFASIANGGYDQSGVFGGTTLYPGMVNTTKYSELDWEVVEETNFGIDASFLDSRLNAEIDYYIRDTENMVINTQLPNGNGYLLQNAGVVRNSGMELMLNWADEIGKDFTYSVGANFSTLKNEVTSLDGQPYLLSGSAEFRQISMVGEALYSFYGWETAGVYQNEAEIEADPIAVANNLKPGDFRYIDQNGDGIINDADRKVLGDYHPDFQYGLFVDLGYKGFNLGVTFQGVGGVDILNRKRGDLNKYPANNLDANLVNSLWTGEGSTNTYPSAEGLYNTWNTGKLTDFLIEDGSYFRVQNVRLSYTFDKEMIAKAGMETLQVYLNADRPYTYHTNNGMTPEVANGIDQQVYPVPAVFSVGAKVSF